MATEYAESNPLLISYKTLRRAVGILGISLPITLYVGCLLIGKCEHIQHSISHYYYTIMGDVLTGTLCAYGIFLITYKGYDFIDNLASNLAGFCAICVALFPTYTNPDLNCSISQLEPNAFRNTVHYISAAVFFLSLAYISFFLFTKSSGEKTKEKIIRNGIYKTCGVLIVLSLVLILLYQKIPWITANFTKYKPVFCLETVALFSFGISWLVKGETIFQDKKESA